MIVTLDGPAGAGKSSVARALARRLGFRFLDTGAMYRAVVLAAQRRNLPWDDKQISQLAGNLVIELQGERVLLDGEDVTQEIRSEQVTTAIHFVADNPAVRSLLVDLQRREAQGGHIVTEGRDQGTVAFPDAQCKFFLTASAEERARRRSREQQDRGERIEFDRVLEQIRQRDRRDESRPVGCLSKADDAIEVVTDGMTLEQVVDHLETIVRQRMVDS
jgi:cytidylate kinase